METPATNDQHEEAEQRIIKVRPTLFVALGGTGMEILLRLRRRILQADWNGRRISRITEFPVASFLYFDTDTREAMQSDRAVSNDPLGTTVKLDEGECLQKKIEVSQYLRDRNRYRHIDAWLPNGEFEKIDTSKGAGQVRAIARLLFFEQVTNLRERVLSKMRALLANVTNERLLSQLGLDIEPRVRVVVLASAAGGTGSGTFLDAGYLLSALRDPQPEAVDLFLFLGTGYVGYGRDRIYANTFATLMELEHCMRRIHEPRFVDGWTDQLRPFGDEAPYNDVFLMDTANLAGQRTADINDVYNMLADVLFEDFGSGEFASRKRSVAVNQQQHKIAFFYAQTPPDVGERVLHYSRAYSSTGQTTVDTKSQVAFDAAVAEASRMMIQAFFGVAAAEKRNLPTAEERDEFAQKYLFLGSTTFDDFPNNMPEALQAIFDYKISNELLKRRDGTSAEASLKTDIDDDFIDLNQQVQNYKDWPAALLRLRDKHRRDVDDNVEQRGRSARGREIEEAARRLWQDWIDRRRLPEALFDRLDNHERGGLDYTIELVQQLKKEIGNDKEGAIARLKEAMDRYSKAADLMMNERFEVSLDNLRQAANVGLFGRRRMAEQILNLAKSDLIYYAVYRLRARACMDAAAMLARVCEYLGETSGLDNKGDSIWTGLIGEFIAGRQAVRATLNAVDSDLRQLADIRARRDATYLVADEKIAFEIPLPPEQVAQWSKEAFEGYGGSARLFSKLREADGQIEIINQLRKIAKQKLEPYEAKLPPARDVLRQMSALDRRNLFDRAVKRCMPWISANTQRMNQDFKSAQYTLLIAVAGATEFRRDFAHEIRELIPSSLGDIVPNVVESSMKGRLVFYCELSGITLDTLVPLHEDWRRAYLSEIRRPERLPLHTFKDADKTVRFPIPLVPSDQELRERQTQMAIFLRGVAYGLLRRSGDRVGAGMPLRYAESDAIYKIEMSRNDWWPIGSEREIRWNGFFEQHRASLERQVLDFEEQMTPLQLLAASALMRYTAERVYAPRFEARGGHAQSRVGSFTHKAAASAAAALLERFDAVGGATVLDRKSPEALIEEMITAIHTWTHEIPGSLDDIDETEANKNPHSSESQDYRARPKRTILAAAFTDSELRHRFLVEPAAVKPTVEAEEQVQSTTPRRTMEQVKQELKTLKEMLDEGIVSEDEYQAKRQMLLNT